MGQRHGARYRDDACCGHGARRLALGVFTDPCVGPRRHAEYRDASRSNPERGHRDRRLLLHRHGGTLAERPALPYVPAPERQAGRVSGPRLPDRLLADLCTALRGSARLCVLLCSARDPGHPGHRPARPLAHGGPPGHGVTVRRRVRGQASADMAVLCDLRRAARRLHLHVLLPPAAAAPVVAGA